MQTFYTVIAVLSSSAALVSVAFPKRKRSDSRTMHKVLGEGIKDKGLQLLGERKYVELN